MKESTVNAEATALSNAVKKSAVAQGATIENNLKAKAAGLSTGAFKEGGYTYNRMIKPNVAPLSAALVLSAKQAVFRQAAKNAINASQVGYDDAKQRMQDRQQEVQRLAYEERKRKEREAEERQRQYDNMIRQQTAAAQAQVRYGGGGTAASNAVGGFSTVSTGNPSSLAMGTVPQRSLSMGTLKTPQLKMGTVNSGTLKMGNVKQQTLRMK